MMRVLFISRGEKNGRDRAAKVLDRYANRTGPDTWICSITAEGLETVREALKSAATRQMSVSCSLAGQDGHTVLWEVGFRSNALPNGSIPIHTHAAKLLETPDSPFLRLGMLANEIAGLAHDLGKASADFQSKLKAAKPMADPVRHEMISFRIFQAALLECSTSPSLTNFGDLWARAGAKLTEENQLDSTPLWGESGNHAISSIWDAIGFLIISHHRLPFGKDGRIPKTSPIGIGASGTIPSAKTFFKNEAAENRAIIPPAIFQDDPEAIERILGQPISRFNDLSHRLNKRLEDLGIADGSAPNSLLFFALSMACRPALILADHERSSIDRSGSPHPDPFVAANTIRQRDAFNETRRSLNQTLDWHLSSVGDRASEIFRNMLSANLPAVSDEGHERMLQRSHGRYDWQNKAADALASRPDPSRPCLIFNLAGTGQGKTRGNLRILASLRDFGSLRVAAGFNLKSLTLQTLDAYREQIGLDEDDLAGVIGDRGAEMLHEFWKSQSSESPILDDDENDPQSEFLFSSKSSRREIPEWLSHALRSEPKTATVVLSPVAVCTIDYLACGMDLPSQGNQATAFMRLISSDLILDEIDGYDPQALVSILRIVSVCAMFGRNIVASSATLSSPAAKAILMAYDFGARLRMAKENPLSSDGDGMPYDCAMIDHALDPEIIPFRGGEQSAADPESLANDFSNLYAKRLERLCSVPTKTYRRPILLEFGENPSEERFFDVCHDAVFRFHNDNSHSYRGKKISIGLLRVANVRQAILLSENLSERFLQFSKSSEDNPYVSVACYHSRITRMRRSHIERRLDALLRRHGELDGQFKGDDEFAKETDAIRNKEAIFLVIATPVEEIGRDHDFDWAIMEPSSAQSLTQTSGRVNRHRLAEIPEEKANIGILEYNFQACSSKRNGECMRNVFARPGMDVSESLESSYYEKSKSELASQINDFSKSSPAATDKLPVSMKILLDWPSLLKRGIDAGIKFLRTENGKALHPLSRFDDESVQETLRSPLNLFSNLFSFSSNEKTRTPVRRGPDGSLPPRQPNPQTKRISSMRQWLRADFYGYYNLRFRPGSYDQSYFLHPDKTDGKPGSRPAIVPIYTTASSRIERNDWRVKTIPRAENDWLVLTDEEADKLAKQSGLCDDDAHEVQITLFKPPRSDDRGFDDTVIWHESFGMKRKSDESD